MIRILQIMDNIAVSSGVSSIVMNIYRNINREKIQFDFLVSNKTEISYENEIQEYGGQIYYTGNPLSANTLIQTCLYNKHFFEENGDMYTAVHLHSPTIAEMTIKYAKKSGIKHIIAHSHSTMFSNNFVKKVLNRYLKRNIVKYANHYFACSTEAAEFLYGEDFCKNHHIELIRNGVEPEKYRFNAETRKIVRNEWGWDEYTIIVHVSNFSPIKNVEFLIPIIKLVTEQRKDIRFLFIGDGKTKADVEKKIEESELEECCKFLGSTNKVNYFLNAADALMLPSIKEGLPVSVVEAQANGMYCFVSDTVTREVSVDNNVAFLKLDESLWIESFMNYKIIDEKDRMEVSERFSESCFNIRNEAERVLKIYSLMGK